MRKEETKVEEAEMGGHTYDTQSGGVLHKYGANNENAGGFILNTAASN